jgi:hypothetical protein
MRVNFGISTFVTNPVKNVLFVDNLEFSIKFGNQNLRTKKATVDFREGNRRHTHSRHLGEITICCPLTSVLSRLDFTLELPHTLVYLFSLSEQKITFF